MPLRVSYVDIDYDKLAARLATVTQLVREVAIYC